jgi:hypothetical protein
MQSKGRFDSRLYDQWHNRLSAFQGQRPFQLAHGVRRDTVVRHHENQDGTTTNLSFNSAVPILSGLDPSSIRPGIQTSTSESNRQIVRKFFAVTP